MSLREAQERLRELVDNLLDDHITVHGWDDGSLVLTDAGGRQLYVEGTEGKVA